jgi:hypothetical protein
MSLMPDREKYIPGIYNYCDRWCERCAFASRCRSYAMERSMKRMIAKKEKQNAEFWAALEKTLGEAIDPAIKQADQLFTDPKIDPPISDLSDPMDEIEKDEMDRRDHFVRDEHPLGRRSMQYMHGVDQFFKTDHPGEPPADAPWRDAWEVIQWYKIFIHVKLCRALHGMLDEREDDAFADEGDDDEGVTTRDSDGSAKIAIIAMERSISAWSMIREHFPRDKQAILQMMGLLAHLRMLADQAFPHAREFHRPGFDDVADDGT